MKKNQLRQAAALLLLTGGLLCSISARADTVTLAPFDASGNATFGLTHAAGSFVDDFLFSISPAMIGHASGTTVVGATWMLPEPADNYSISNIKFFMVNPDSSHTDVTTIFNASTLRFRADGPLAAGNYGFEVTGLTTLAGMGGSYAGNLNVMTTPVPEPATFAMLAAGLGILGLARRREKQDKFS
jgi:hypothetical protein